MNINLVITIAGSIASIVGLFLRAPESKTNRVIQVIYGLSIAVFIGIAIINYQKPENVDNPINSVNVMLDDIDMKYTNEGFVNGALVFLEANDESFPDAYKRANEIYNDSTITSMVDKKYAIMGILQGIKDVAPNDSKHSFLPGTVVSKILISLFVVVIGFFLRDVYEWIKIYVKNKKPKLSLRHEAKINRVYGTNPRNYEFASRLSLQNIDEMNLYNIQIVLIDKDSSTVNEVALIDRLKPDESFVYKDSITLPYGEKGHEPEVVEKLLPRIFTNPTIKVKYENGDDQKYEILEVF